MMKGELLEKTKTINATVHELKLQVENYTNLDRLDDATAELATKTSQLEAALEDLKHFDVWSTSASGTFTVHDIMGHYQTGKLLVHGAYDCILKTGNGAHWVGYRFLMIVNYYGKSDFFPHKLYDAMYLDAGSNGCSDRITAFDAEAGSFSYAQGNCHQTLTLRCKPRY
eukprot:TRINITY_DN5953_c0_g1_i2.p1 TRINITY_DN5953_c0_g1~~TRINITY_DN5953_c0_g1_i2.p1  ORF type:complete len:169 (+),score=22.14 TRINITY_DN5953_c0_g1_i2:763-1269(+)